MAFRFQNYEVFLCEHTDLTFSFEVCTRLMFPMSVDLGFAPPNTGYQDNDLSSVAPPPPRDFSL